MPEPRTLMTGVPFGESPRWHDGRLWFCDWGAEELISRVARRREHTDGERSGQMLAVDVESPHAGRP